MPNSCTICSHDDRAEIENAILNLTADAPPNSQNTIEKISEDFNVDLTELKAHALFHTPLSGDDLTTTSEYISAMPEELEDEPIEIDLTAAQASVIPSTPRDSLARKMKLREADLLSAVSNEYLVTLKTMGRKINKLAATSSIDVEEQDNQLRIARLLTKPMVDLYVGLGGEIRQNVKTMAELDRLLNGPEDNGNSGLKALAVAIAMSPPSQDTEE